MVICMGLASYFEAMVTHQHVSCLLFNVKHPYTKLHYLPTHHRVLILPDHHKGNMITLYYLNWTN